MDKNKVLVLFCGGTIVMKENQEGALEPPLKDEAIESLLNIEPRINNIADISVHYIANIDSTNMKPSYWDQMLKVLQDEYDNYDGFVITHGTDTVAYTASALTFALHNLGKPVILTGSQIPGNEMETDARRNFVNSVKLATMNISGVYVVFDERIMLGVRSSKTSESALDAYSSINAEDAGEIRIEIRLQDWVPTRHNKKLKVILGFEPDISIITLAPGNDPTDLEYLLDSDKIRGLIINGYGPGNIPYEHYRIFEKAKSTKIPVLIRSQCLHGMTTMRYYDVGAQALKLGVIEGYDMSIEAASTKLMWTIKHYPYEKVAEIMMKDFAGEIDMEKNIKRPTF